MTYEEMLQQATLYNEMLQTLSKKPRLITESKVKIAKLKEEVEEIELESAKSVMTEVNPKKFSFFKKKAAVDPTSEILKKELEIRAEEKKIDLLQATNASEFVDIVPVANQVNAIVEEQNKIIGDLKNEIYETWNKFHGLLDKYEKEYKAGHYFHNTMSKKIDEIKEDGQAPLPYAGGANSIKGINGDHNINRFLNERQRDSLKVNSFLNGWK